MEVKEPSLTSSSKRALLICHEAIGENMAGPAVRCTEMAGALRRHLDVTLAHPGHSMGEDLGFHLATYDRFNPRSLAPLVDWADVVILHCYLLHRLPFLRDSGKPIVVDVYDPFTFENIEHRRHLLGQDQLKAGAADLAILNNALRSGDFYVCANERQRDFWLGMLLANGRVNPFTYGNDRTLRRLVDVVPFGISSTPPQATRRALKGIHPKIGADDKLLLWGGGLWDWFDPITLVKAVARVCNRRSDVKLFFMAKQHIDPAVVPAMRTATRAMEMSRQLGLSDEHIFFGDWVPYRDRANYLLEADIGVSLHLDGVETRLAFRTRLMDCIWAGLPILATGGDSLSEVVAAEGLGRIVPPGDADAVAEAILSMLAEEGLRSRLAPDFARVAGRFTWEEVTKPLVRYLLDPVYSDDRRRSAVVPRDCPSTEESAVEGTERISLRTLSSKAWRRLRSGGVRAIWWDFQNFAEWWGAYRLYRGSRGGPPRGGTGA